jgi:hypothetical protein
VTLGDVVKHDADCPVFTRHRDEPLFVRTRTNEGDDLRVGGGEVVRDAG